MNIPTVETRGLVSPVSADATPSDKYIGWWPMTQWTGAIGALAGTSITVSAASNVSAAGDYVSGVTAATWITAGAPIKVRNTGTIPPGLSANTVYYASKPTADRVSFHSTQAAALAGIGAVDITDVGTNNLVLYPAHIKDWSGQGNDMIFGAATSDQDAWQAAPYLSNASSGSNDERCGRLASATFAARWVWPTNSLFVFFRGKFGTLVADRSFWGCGSASTHGPRFRVDAGAAGYVTAQLIHAGGTLTIGTSAAEAVSESVEHSIAMLLDASRLRAYMWIDGARDNTVNEVDLSAAETVTVSSDIGIGGSMNNNTQAGHWSDYHLLSLTGTPNLTAMDALIARMHSSRYYRIRSRDI